MTSKFNNPRIRELLDELSGLMDNVPEELQRDAIRQVNEHASETKAIPAYIVTANVKEIRKLNENHALHAVRVVCIVPNEHDALHAVKDLFEDAHRDGDYSTRFGIIKGIITLSSDTGTVWSYERIVNDLNEYHKSRGTFHPVQEAQIEAGDKDEAMDLLKKFMGAVKGGAPGPDTMQ